MPYETNSSDLAPDRGIGHTARLEPWSLPTHNIPYKMSVNESDEVKKHVVVFLVRCLLLPNISSYGAPVMFGHNDSLWMCINYRALNKNSGSDTICIVKMIYLIL